MKELHIDNRGLQPPEPMVRILEACATLHQGDRIIAEMDRRPVFLFPELDERNVRYECVERSGGGYLLTLEQQ